MSGDPVGGEESGPVGLAALQRAFAALGAGVVVHDPQGSIVEANGEASRILGLTVEQMWGRSSLDPAWAAVHEDGSPFPGEMHPSMVCLATGRPVRDVVMGVHKPDGSVTWILINAEPLPAPADGPVSVVTVFTEITALQTALEATSLSAARFRALAECSADVVLEASPEGMLSWVSPSVTALLGWQPDDLKGRSLFGLLHPDDLPRAVAAQRRLAAGETLSLDGRVRTSEGGFRWLRSRVCPVVDESGALIGRVGSWLDIEAEVAEAAAGTSIDPRVALQDAQERYRLLAENASDVVCLTGPDRRLTWVSPSITRALGWRPEELVGTFLADLMHPDDRALIEVGRDRLYTVDHPVGPPRGWVLRFRTGTDGYRWMSGLPTPVVDASGRLMSVVSGLRDVNDLVETQQQLARAAALLERTGEIAHVGGWEHDAVTGEGVWTSEIYRILELDPSAVPSRTGAIRDHLSGDAPARLDAAIEQAMATGTRWDIELPAVTATGRPIWLRSQGEPVIVDGVVVKTRGALQEITERRQLEAQLLHAATTEAIGRLAGGVAHDFNNMLAVILGRTELALSQLRADDPLRADLLDVHNAAERSADLTKQLLTFARQQPTEPRAVDPNDAVARMAPLLNRLIGENITLTWNTDPDVWPIKIDPSQFDQVITNLVVNARDSIAADQTNGGTITVSVTNTTLDIATHATHLDVPPCEYVHLTVADNGPGLDAYTETSIFDPFFTTKGAGHGLGLSTVSGIVKQNNGLITVTSTPGHGATFEVLLPRHHGPTEPAPDPQPADHKRRATETLLVVEDEPSILELITTILETEGYTVLAASNATDALRIASEHPTPIELLLTDVVMPDLGGPELATRLTAAGIHTRHLFMSGYTADTHTHTHTDTTHFLQKPFTINALTTKIRDILDTPTRPPTRHRLQ